MLMQCCSLQDKMMHCVCNLKSPAPTDETRKDCISAVLKQHSHCCFHKIASLMFQMAPNIIAFFKLPYTNIFAAKIFGGQALKVSFRGE
jgi:hypothetical protein